MPGMPTRRWRALGLVLAVLGSYMFADAGAANLEAPTRAGGQPRKQVGCWWYHNIPRYTNRTLASLEPGTCTFVDIGSACAFTILPNGSLSTRDPACNEQTESIVADARLVRQSQPDLEFKWVLQADSPSTFTAVWNSTALTDRLVGEIADWASVHKDIANGWTLDFETHYSGDETAAKAGLTRFLAGLKARTGRGMNWWGWLYAFKNLADVAAVQPFIEFLETGGYYNDLTSRNPHIFELSDVDELISSYGYKPEQVRACPSG